MFFVSHKKIQKLTSVLICICIISAPFSTNLTLKKAEAGLISIGGGGRIVYDPQNTLTNTLQTITAQALQQKELILDGLFRNIAQKALQQLTSDILSFVNSGMDGNPAFITDISSDMESIADKQASEFIYNDDLSTLCTSFQLDVRIAITAQFQLEHEGGFKEAAKCTTEKAGVDVEAFLSGNFSAGGWGTYLETVLNPTNTYMGAYLGGTIALDAQIASKQQEYLTEANWNNGFKSQKKCSMVNTPAGQKEACTTTTPGVLIQEQATAALNAPMQSLINADEFDEVIGNLFGNLAQQAISGINGLLGLSDQTYGSGSNQSYFDAIKNDPTNTSSNGTDGSNPIATALATETRVGTAEIGIINAINDIIRCSPTTVLPVELQGIITEFTPKVIATGNVVATLADMEVAYASSTSASEQASLLTRLESMKSNGDLAGLPAAIEYEQFLNFELKDYIAEFKIDTGYVEVTCPAVPTP